MKDFPKVTIIMATYNRASFIVETLQSIHNQTFTDWECLIVDDGGTDNTAEVIALVLEQDKRFLLLKRPDAYLKGLPGCRNYGIDIAKGEYVIFFDDDDIAHPQNLELCVKELSTKDISFCRYLRSVFAGDFNRKFDFSKEYTSFYIGLNDIERVLKNELPFNSCAVMWKKGCFEENRFVEMLMYAEEWELYSRILSNGFKGISIDKCLFYGRKHPNSNTGEFYNSNPIRIASKKEAIRLITFNLARKKILTESLLKYLSGLAIVFRDTKLLNDIVSKAGIKSFNKLFLQLKYWLFPLWKVYKRSGKKVKTFIINENHQFLK
jgi:glycosyltransferase involved in cell wall biosynthesis